MSADGSGPFIVPLEPVLRRPLIHLLDVGISELCPHSISFDLWEWIALEVSYRCRCFLSSKPIMHLDESLSCADLELRSVLRRDPGGDLG